ncbi:MAG: hypothetical protein PWP76_301 [Candidatus Diapherotrites archaeon]|nr:hypothetical protein [Candidatus Diapherotrites archaeon]MDN5366821.1 hypothetical protein [Candidatus Diapherotrites archaeon]
MADHQNADNGIILVKDCDYSIIAHAKLVVRQIYERNKIIVWILLCPVKLGPNASQNTFWKLLSIAKGDLAAST